MCSKMRFLRIFRRKCILDIKMLIEFTVGNYKSFKEKTTFSMVAANLHSQDKRLDENNVFKVDKKLSLLKSAAIYGANASGKSNLISAIAFMTRFIADSATFTQFPQHEIDYDVE